MQNLDASGSWPITHSIGIKVKAAVFKALGDPLAVEEVADPVPGPGEVLIKVSRCGICGTDLHITEDPIFGAPPGMVLGHEFAGEIVATGARVEAVRSGDHVAILPVRSCGRCQACLAGHFARCLEMQITGGGYGQYALAQQQQCVKLPSTVSLADGALVEPLAVGLHGANAGPVTSGSRVLVIGAGPIGLAAAFWARRLGAVHVAVTASSTRRESLAFEMGATAFVAPSENLGAAVNKALHGPPDIVFEAVGKPGLLATAVDLVRSRGTVVLLGLCTAADHYNPFQTMLKEVRIHPSMLYDLSEFRASVDVLNAGVLAPRSMVTETVSLAGLPAAFEALRHRTTQCKTLVDAWSP
jgi:(R,R)-butanediol dehydrogenase/meso-butanediol dehydrogenase/diacetyl reductase